MDDYKNTGLIDREKALKIFSYLNERLKENQLNLEITIYGGAVMTIVYDSRPATKDIDCVFSETNSKILANILSLTKDVFGLSDNWINEDIKEPLMHILREDKETYRAYSNLKILKPRAEQLLAMKILAARAEPSKDFVDAFLLCKELKISSKLQLMEIVLSYVPVNLIRERQITFIKYLGEDLGYDWQ